MRQWCKSSWEIFKPQAIRVWKGVEAAARAPHRQATRRRRLVKLLFTRFSLTRAFVYLIPTTHTLDDSPLRFHETTSPFVCTEKPAKTIRLVYYSWFSRPPPPLPQSPLLKRTCWGVREIKKKVCKGATPALALRFPFGSAHRREAPYREGTSIYRYILGNLCTLR